MISKMNPLRFEIMTSTEYARYRKEGAERYAKESPKYRHMPIEVSLPLVLKETNQYFGSAGLAEPGQYYRELYLESEAVGYLHFAETPKDSKSLYIWDFLVYDGNQGKGYGRAALELLRAFAKENGFQKIGLNVFADNDRAIHLYRSLGFEPTQMNMELEL